LIRLHQVGHVYAAGTPWARRALSGVTIDIERGEGILVVGSNGSGKSTLAWILAGLLIPSEGEALLDDEPIDKAGPKAAIAFQHARLQLFRPTVAEDVVFGSRVEEEDVDTALTAVGLESSDIRDRRIDELSGGQQRRVAIAGLLARRPELLVLDEPFAGLDAEGRETLIEVVAGLRVSQNLALVVVSHDYEDATRYAQRIVALEGGRIVLDRPAEEALAGGELAAVEGLV
jgi:energy-coupling factor transport system ATP-binding protein